MTYSRRRALFVDMKGKKKYGKVQIKTVKRNGKTVIPRGTKGQRTPEERRALIYPQAQNIIQKFGGPGKVAAALKDMSDDPKDHYHRTSIYRWMYPVEAGGTGGEIPVRALKLILKAARYAGILLTTADIYPNLIDVDYVDDRTGQLVLPKPSNLD